MWRQTLCLSRLRSLFQRLLQRNLLILPKELIQSEKSRLLKPMRQTNLMFKPFAFLWPKAVTAKSYCNLTSPTPKKPLRLIAPATLGPIALSSASRLSPSSASIRPQIPTKRVAKP
jgi:hypothetical protein